VVPTSFKPTILEWDFAPERTYKMARRSFDQEKAFLEKLSPNAWKIKKGFVPNMKVGFLVDFLLL